MNLYKILYEILRDFHKLDDNGLAIRDLLIELYIRTSIQWEDIKALMVEYCERGSLTFSNYPAFRG